MVVPIETTLSKMLVLKFFLNLSLYLILICAGFIQDRLFDGIVMHIDRYDNQCNGRNVPFKMSIHGVRTVATKMLLRNCTVIASEEGFKNVMLTMIINRCRSKENLDTCEEYFKQGNIDFCKAIDPNNPLVTRSPFYIPFVPPLKCPVNKGIYNGYNISIDLAPFFVFQVEGWYWRIKTELVSERKRLLFCSFIDGYVTKSQSKIK